MQLPAHILSSAEINALTGEDFVEWCALTGSSAIEASNAFARQIAKDYLAGRLAYVYCDRVMNSIMTAVTTKEFLSVSDRNVPEHVEAVYLAFDAGEYVHEGDLPAENQEYKYTRPMLLSFLRSTSRT